MSQPLLVKNHDGIITLTLNLPELRNPISGEDMQNALIEAMSAADRDLSVRAVILTGAGSAFSSGGNVNDMQMGRGIVDSNPAATRHNYRHGIQRLPRLFETIEVPVIAAVNGAAVGAGCDLACMCDIRIAGRAARFSESFVKLGIIPGDGGAWLLPSVVGYSKACELAFTGDMIDAQEALACGLVSRVVADNELVDAAMAWAVRIAANSAHAVRMTKRLMREARLSTLSAVLEMSANAQAVAHATGEHADALKRFIDRREKS